MEIVKNAVIKQTWQNGHPAGSARTIGGPDGLLSKLIPFTSQGAMWARRYSGTRDAESFGRYNTHVGDGLSVVFPGNGVEGPLYVVYSYNTPIGWVTSSGSLHIPDEKYSPTTSHHQGLVNAWMGKGDVWSDQDQARISWTTQAVRDALRGRGSDVD